MQLVDGVAPPPLDGPDLGLREVVLVGISGGHERTVTVPMYRVDDIEEAVRLVRELGGSATDPEVQPYGISSSCTDNQGTRFYLGQL